MPNYKKMYFRLFHAVTDAISILQQAQVEAEEEYIRSDEEDENKIVELKVVKKDNEPFPD